MVEKTITVADRLGLHARAAGAIVRLSESFRSKIMLEKNGRLASARSILDILLLAAGKDSRIRVSAVGDDEVEALAAVENLISLNFLRK